MLAEGDEWVARTMGADREQHTINFFRDSEERQGTYQWLQQLQKDNDLDDMGETMEFLRDWYCKMLVDYPAALEQAETDMRAREDAETLVAQYQELHEEYERKKKSLDMWTQQAAQAQQTPYLPIEAVKRMIEAGMGTEDIIGVHKIIASSGLDPVELVTAIKQVGGAAPLIRQVELLRQERDSLDAQRSKLAAVFHDEKCKAADALAVAIGKVKAAEAQAAEKQRRYADTDEMIAQVREYAGNLEMAYRLMGLVMEGPVHAEMDQWKVGRFEHLPPKSLALLAGMILTLTTTLHGDHEFTLRPFGRRVVTAPLLLSEIPALLAIPATPDIYKPQVELMLQQLEAMQIEEEDDEDEEEEEDEQ